MPTKPTTFFLTAFEAINAAGKTERLLEKRIPCNDAIKHLSRYGVQVSRSWLYNVLDGRQTYVIAEPEDVEIDTKDLLRVDALGPVDWRIAIERADD